jgi:heat shock protein HspQ
MTSFEFEAGQVIHHRLFEYRGVIVECDPTFSGTEEWYRQVARSQPPRDEPWYHVLVHGGAHTTYVAQRNLAIDLSGRPIAHPLLRLHFNHFEKGRYSVAGPAN